MDNFVQDIQIFSYLLHHYSDKWRFVLQHQGHRFDSQGMHELIKCYFECNVTLDENVSQMHKIVKKIQFHLTFQNQNRTNQ